MKPGFAIALVSLAFVTLVGCGQSSTRPTATRLLEPTATLISGWHRVTGKGVSISLPDTFVGGDFSESNRKDIRQRLNPSNQISIGLIDALERTSTNLILLFAVNTESSESDSSSTLTIISETVPEALHPLTHLESRTRTDLAFPFTVKVKEELKVDGNPAGRMIIEWGEKGAREITYAIRYKTRMYVISFSISHNEFEKMLPIIEQSIQTLTINPHP
ncbi:hypothetical protein TFLX_00061 [Thermoflexales bacterium]|nr:hypothetical protein TFLX_00061 [Thermoflexales bacterium]